MSKQTKPYYYLPFLLGALFLVWLLASCSMTKHVNKEKTKETTEINTETATTRTISETATTTIETQSIALEGQKAIDLILAGDSVFEETPDLEIITKEVNGIIHTRAIKKATSIPVSINKVTVEKVAIYTNETDKKETQVKIKDVERKGINLNYLWWLLLLLLIPVWKCRKWFLV